MSLASRSAAWGIAILVGGTLWSAWHLLEARFQDGNVHAPYSSLRADPLGTRALHDALKRLPRSSVVRLIESPSTLERPAGTSLLVLGMPPAETPEVPGSLVRGLEEFARAGGRVVVALLPQPRENWSSTRLERRAARPRSTAESEERPSESLRERWGFQIAYGALEVGEDARVRAATAERTSEAEAELPANVPWHSGVHLVLTTNAWRECYLVGEEPVLAVRRFGAGWIVLSTDAYPFSNEALRLDRQTPLLEWYLSARPIVAFNETHLGVERVPGVAGLARRYRLGGFLAGFVLLAGLFVWRSLAAFVPRQAPAPAESTVQGLGSDAGLATLIQRSIPASDLPRVCFEEWHRSFAAHDSRWAEVTAALVEQVRVDASRGPHARDPVRTVAAMMEVVASRRPTAAFTGRPLLDPPRP